MLFFTRTPWVLWWPQIKDIKIHIDQIWIIMYISCPDCSRIQFTSKAPLSWLFRNISTFNHNNLHIQELNLHMENGHITYLYLIIFHLSRRQETTDYKILPILPTLYIQWLLNTDVICASLFLKEKLLP